MLNVIVKRFLFGWRISVGIPFVIGTYLALGMFLLPRSPRSGQLASDTVSPIAIMK